MLTKFCKFFWGLLIISVAFSQSSRAQNAPLSPDSLVKLSAGLLPDVRGDSIANYEMEVALDPAEKRVRGKMRLSWTNATQFPATELQFHLYYNAWRNNKSSYFNSVRYRDYDLSDFGEDDWGYCDIQSMKILSNDYFIAEDVVSVLEFIQPDDGNPFDRTVARLPLRRSVFPGETIELAITWETKVPRPVNRTGAIGDYFFLAQWFPKIGVFENNGLWNCHQFTQTEFYADFGTYDVRITIPAGWKIGATGREISRNDYPDSTTMHRFFQKSVHDFVWVASPVFSEFTQRFEEPGLPPVEMRLLLQPYNLDKRERYFQSAKTSLKYYGTWCGAYPYGHITIIDPAYQSESGGMEYPTLFTGGSHWLSPAASRQPESVTIHEAGHQFWYGLIANNEFEHAWLDEGFNSYTQYRIFRQHFPRWPLTVRYLENLVPVVFPDVYFSGRTDGADIYDGFRTNIKRDPMATPSRQYGPKAYRVDSYVKPSLMLQTLENYLGWPTFQKILSTYFARWRFRHPTPRDFFDVVNEVSGQNMDWFFRDAYHGSNVYDYAVGKVISGPEATLKGYSGSRGELSYQSADDAAADALPPQIQSEVYIRRWGEAVFPIDIKMTFENGEEVLEHWDGKKRWTLYKYRRAAYLQKVEVDPAHKLVLDVNYTNNSWTRHPAKVVASWKWTTKWMIWLQNMVDLLAFFS